MPELRSLVHSCLIKPGAMNMQFPVYVYSLAETDLLQQSFWVKRKTQCCSFSHVFYRFGGEEKWKLLAPLNSGLPGVFRREGKRWDTEKGLEVSRSSQLGRGKWVAKKDWLMSLKIFIIMEWGVEVGLGEVCLPQHAGEGQRTTLGSVTLASGNQTQVT